MISITRFINAIFSIYAFLVFVSFMLIILPFVLIASFFGKVRGGNIIYKLCRFWADGCLVFWGIRHQVIYEAPHNTRHPNIFVFNHNSYMDIPEMMVAIKQNFRALGKSEMTKIPLFGFIYRNAVVTVERGSAENRAKSVETLKSILKKNISVAIAPEGTFNMSNKPLKEFYDGAFKIAIETQTPIKPLIFLDAVDRLHYKSIFSFKPGKLRTVFLEEVKTEGLGNEDIQELKQKVYAMMESALVRYKASWIQ